MDKKKFLDTLMQNEPFWQRKPIYDYSKSSDENAEMGSALENVQYMPEEEWKKRFGEMYVRRQEGDPLPDENLPQIPTEQEVKPVMQAKPVQAKPQAPVAKPEPKAPLKSLEDIVSKAPALPNPADLAAAKSPVDLSKLLAQVKPIESDNELLNAQNERDDMLRKLLILQGMHEVGAAIGGVKAQADYTKPFGELAEKKVTNVKERSAEKQKLEEMNRARRNQALSEIQAQNAMDDSQFNRQMRIQDQALQMRQQAISEARADFDLKKAQIELGDMEKERDPNSNLSKAFEAYVQDYINMSGANLKVPKGLSYAQLSKQLGVLSNVVTQKMAQDARKDLAIEKEKDRELKREELKKEKSSKFLNQVDQEIKRSDAYKSVKKLSLVEKGIQNAMTNPSSQSDIDVLYNFVKLLDQDSAVREGEIGLAQQALGLRERLQIEMSRLGPKPRILSDKFIRGVNDLVAIYGQLAKDRLNKELSTKRKISKGLGVSPQEFDETFNELYMNPDKDLENMKDEDLDAELKKLKGQ